MRKCFIMRGLPGSGKSTIASEIADGLDDVVTVSADDYFMGEGGAYNFDVTKLSNAHLACQSNFRDAIDSEVENVIVDNTNVKTKDWKFYADYAREAGYAVVTCVIEEFNPEVCARRGTHDVPEEVVARFAREFAR